MRNRVLPILLALSLTLIAGCQPGQEFEPNATDVDLWEVHDIRIDTEVPNQYPDGKSGLTGAHPAGTYGSESDGDSH